MTWFYIEKCYSFEHSNSKQICNLNMGQNPTQAQNEDYAFCMKNGNIQMLTLNMHVI